MATRRIRLANIRRYVPDAAFVPSKPASVLPEAYRKFWREWRKQPEPVHYIPEQGRWKRNSITGEVSPVQNVPLPLKFPKESNQQLWGGEAVIAGYQKRKRYQQKVPHFWVPKLEKTVVYSEILNKYMTVIVTDRAMNMIHKNFGFDHYILKTEACDLRTNLALKLKQKLLTALLKKDLHHEDPAEKENVFNKYKQYLSNYTEEEIEWYGLTIDEALAKFNEQQEESRKQKIQPLKHQYRIALINELLEKETETKALPEEKPSWLSKINPFQNSKS